MFSCLSRLERGLCYFRLARSGKWNDLKKLAKTKKLPMSVTSIVKLARKHGGEDAAKMFLTDEFLNNEDKFNLMVKFIDRVPYFL